MSLELAVAIVFPKPCFLKDFFDEKASLSATFHSFLHNFLHHWSSCHSITTRIHHTPENEWCATKGSLQLSFNMATKTKKRSNTTVSSSSSSNNKKVKQVMEPTNKNVQTKLSDSCLLSSSSSSTMNEQHSTQQQVRGNLNQGSLMTHSTPSLYAASGRRNLSNSSNKLRSSLKHPMLCRRNNVMMSTSTSLKLLILLPMNHLPLMSKLLTLLLVAPSLSLLLPLEAPLLLSLPLKMTLMLPHPMLTLMLLPPPPLPQNEESLWDLMELFMVTDFSQTVLINKDPPKTKEGVCFERVNNKIRLLIKGRTNEFVVSPNTRP